MQGFPLYVEKESLAPENWGTTIYLFPYEQKEICIETKKYQYTSVQNIHCTP